MSANYPIWFGAAATALTIALPRMLTRMLARPVLKARCAACGRLFRRSIGLPLQPSLTSAEQ